MGGVSPRAAAVRGGGEISWEERGSKLVRWGNERGIGGSRKKIRSLLPCASLATRREESIFTCMEDSRISGGSDKRKIS